MPSSNNTSTATTRLPNSPAPTNQQPNTDHPLVSIIIPCYNAEKYIAEAIQSALDQTYPNCEVIVIDDGSTDNSLTVIKRFGSKIFRKTGPNRGGCAARNNGLNLSKGEWVQFLDADDMLPPNKILLQMEALKGATDCVSDCRIVRFSTTLPASLPLSNLPKIEGFEMPGVDYVINQRNSRLTPITNPTNNPMIGASITVSWLIPRSLIEKSGDWDESLFICQDNDFFCRICLVARKVIFEEQAYGLYRIPSKNSVSRGTSERNAKSIYTAFLKSENILKHRNDVEARVAVARGYFVVMQRTFKDYPKFSILAKSRIKWLGIPLNILFPTRSQSVLCKLLGWKSTMILIIIWRRIKS